MLGLDGTQWRAASSDGGIRIGATVPGDLVTDLQAAALIPDPLFDQNFLNSTLWGDRETGRTRPPLRRRGGRGPACWCLMG